MGKIFRRIRYAEVGPEADPDAVGARNVPAARNSIKCGGPSWSRSERRKVVRVFDR
jgi:hypothetical protein